MMALLVLLVLLVTVSADGPPTTCDPGWTLPEGENACTSCESGKYKETTGTEDCTTCADNSSGCGVQSRGQCKAGYGFKVEGEGDTMLCEACVSGKYKPNAGNVICTDCAGNNTGCSGLSVGTCDIGYGSTDGGVTCIACTSNSGTRGQYKLTAGNTPCKPCSNNSSGCGGGTLGTCNAGYGTVNGGEKCLKCPDNNFKLEPGNVPCTRCEENKFSCGDSSAGVCNVAYGTTTDGGTSCTFCTGIKGLYKDIASNAQCFTCDPNSIGCGGFNPGLCKAGWTSADGGRTCSECDANTYKIGENNDECVTCSTNNTGCGGASVGTCNAGFGSSHENGSLPGSMCVECKPSEGKYKVSAGNTACVTCATNGTGCGGTAIGECKAGFGSIDGGISCDACPEGISYKTDNGNESCRECDPGSTGCGGNAIGTSTRPPTGQPTSQPSALPTAQPTSQPSIPTGQPTSQPSAQPSAQPTSQPSIPTGQPTSQPSMQPTSQPTSQPTAQPSAEPTSAPTMQPSSAVRTEVELFIDQVLTGMTKDLFDADAQNDFLQAVWKALLPTYPNMKRNVLSLTDVEELPSRRKLGSSDSSKRRQLAVTGVKVKYRLLYVAEDLGCSDSKCDTGPKADRQLRQSLSNEATSNAITTLLIADSSSAALKKAVTDYPIVPASPQGSYKVISYVSGAPTLAPTPAPTVSPTASPSQKAAPEPEIKEPLLGFEMPSYSVYIGASVWLLVCGFFVHRWWKRQDAIDKVGVLPRTADESFRLTGVTPGSSSSRSRRDKKKDKKDKDRRRSSSASAGSKKADTTPVRPMHISLTTVDDNEEEFNL